MENFPYSLSRLVCRCTPFMGSTAHEWLDAWGRRLPRQSSALLLKDVSLHLDFQNRNKFSRYVILQMFITNWTTCIEMQSPCQLQSRYIKRGRERVKRDIDCQSASGKCSLGFRRLLLSLEKIKIRQGDFNEAEGIYRRAFRYFQRCHSTNCWW